MATVMTAHVQDSRRAVLLIAGADGLKHLSSAAEAGTSAFKFGTTEQPHSTGVHDAIAGQKLDAKAASRLLVSSTDSRIQAVSYRLPSCTVYRRLPGRR